MSITPAGPALRSLREWIPTLIGAFLMLAGAIASSAVHADDKLEMIVDNVRVNEELYRDIETITHVEFRLGNPKFKMGKLLQRGTTTCRTVLQGDLIYLKVDDHAVDVNKRDQGLSTLQGYDGEKTRVIEQDAIANIHEGRVVDPRLKRFNPYTMSFWRWGNIQFPLSTLLRGTETVRKQPGWESQNVGVSLEGEDNIDGMRCVRLRCRFWDDSSREPPKNAAYWDFWLAIDRNYLPIRQKIFTGRMHAQGQPEFVVSLSDLREISPGIWYPMRASLVVYDDASFVEDHKLLVSNSEEYVVEKVELSPHYDISLFRDITIPDGMLVYHVRNGQIYKTTKQGVGDIRSSTQGGWPGWWWVPVAAILGMAGLFVARRAARRRKVLRSA